MSSETSHLYATSNFLEGMATTLDMSGSMSQYNSSATPQEADAKAMQSDWYAVGNDIRGAIKQYEQK